MGSWRLTLSMRKTFVVAQADVEAGLEFLDQAAFEQEGFGFVADNVDVEIVDGLDQGVELRSQPRRREGWKYWLTRLRRSRALPT